MCLIVLIKLKVSVMLDYMELLAEYNSTYFYSVTRILIEYSHENSLSLVQSGVVNVLCKHSILSTVNQSLLFYSNSLRY